MAAPTAADACSCLGSGFAGAFTPATDGVVRPPNTRIRLEYLRDEPGPHEVLEDGVPREDVIQEVEVHGETFLVTLSTEDPLTPGALVEVFGTEFSESLVRFTVGTELDDTPPSWDGAFTVKSFRDGGLHLSMSSCGRSQGHAFEWIDLDDDVWPTEEILVVGVPDVDGGSSFVDAGPTGSVFHGGVCSNDDETLLTDLHRVYTVFVEDGSGNRIGPFEVDTRGPDAACGCASSTPAAGSAWWALAALAVLRRRRVRNDGDVLPRLAAELVAQSA